jgi:hypothetical protein
MKRVTGAVAVFLFSLPILAGRAGAQADRLANHRLVNLPPIDVRLTFYNTEKEYNDAIDPQGLSTQIELRLRQNHIRVATAADEEKIVTAKMTVEIETDLLPDNAGRIFTFRVRVTEPGCVYRKGKATFATAIIWEHGPILGGLSRSRDYAEAAHKYILNNVDEFINDYLAANTR